MFYRLLLVFCTILICSCQSNGFSNLDKSTLPVEWQVIHNVSKDECPNIAGTYQMQGLEVISYHSQDPDIRFTDVWYNVIHPLPYDAKSFSVIGTKATDFAIAINGARLSISNIFNELSKYPIKNIYCESGAIVLSISRSFTGMHSGKINESRNYYFFATSNGSLAVLKKSTFKSLFEEDDISEKWSLFQKVK